MGCVVFGIKLKFQYSKWQFCKCQWLYRKWQRFKAQNYNFCRHLVVCQLIGVKFAAFNWAYKPITSFVHNKTNTFLSDPLRGTSLVKNNQNSVPTLNFGWNGFFKANWGRYKLQNKTFYNDRWTNKNSWDKLFFLIWLDSFWMSINQGYSMFDDTLCYAMCNQNQPDQYSNPHRNAAYPLQSVSFQLCTM